MGTHGQTAGLHTAKQIVKAHVAHQPLEGSGNRLEGERAGQGNTTGQDRVGAYIGAHIDKGITGPEYMEHKGHVSCFVKAAVNIHGGARHPGFDNQRGAAQPGHEHRHTHKAAAKLPTQEAGYGAGDIAFGKRVALPVTKQGDQFGNGT